MAIKLTQFETTIGDSDMEVFASTDLGRYNSVTFYVQNTGNTALLACKIQVSPTGEDNTWIDIDTTGIGGLAPSGIARKSFSGQSDKWYRIIAKTASGITTIKTWVSANLSIL